MEGPRLFNINQEYIDVPPIWPYGGTFLPQFIVAPLGLPYGSLQLYPQLQHAHHFPVITSSVLNANANGGAASPMRWQHANSEANKLNLQNGLQCTNQNNPGNVSSVSDSETKLDGVNFCGDSIDKEFPSSVLSSPIVLSADSDLNSSSSNGTSLGGASGDSANSSGTITISRAKFNELRRLALRGSEIAEKLAQTHRNRPCFKKIDSLCARMKQDLIRPDGVLPNINSQGIAWAVKDFIFVFTRIINAWIIIKGYVYNTPEGLNKVKAALTPEFIASFSAWQDVTIDFVENLIKSFVNLDNLVQSQKNVYHRSDGINSRGSASTPIKLSQPLNSLIDDSFDLLNSSDERSQHDQLNKNYIYTMVEDSEASQQQARVNGTYFKTGTYNPIKKECLQSDGRAATPSSYQAPNVFQTPNSYPAQNNYSAANSFPTPTNNLPTANSFPTNNSFPAPNTFRPPVHFPAPTNFPMQTTFPALSGFALPATFPAPINYPTTFAYPAAVRFPAPSSFPVGNHYPIPNCFPTGNNHHGPPNYPTEINVPTANNYPTTQLPSEHSNIPLEKHFFNALHHHSLENQSSGEPTDCPNDQIEPECANTNEIHLPTWFTNDPYVSEDNASGGFDVYESDEESSSLETSFTEKLNMMISRIMGMKHAEYFFKMQFTRNYFPEFVEEHKDDFIDIRSIILKCQVGGYEHVYEIIDDMKKIVYTGKEFLQNNIDAKLRSALCDFEFELHTLLSEPFENFQFEYILCNPHQMICNAYSR